MSKREKFLLSVIFILLFLFLFTSDFINFSVINNENSVNLVMSINYKGGD